MDDREPSGIPCPTTMMGRQMKKFFTVLLLVWAVLPGIYSQNKNPIDLVVILDTSSSMNSSYREVSDYITGPFLREFLRIGDTFHLISFAGEPNLELSRRIEGSGDIETIIGRMLIMYPLAPHSDIAGAIDYGRRYAADLPGGRAKKVVLISDGDHSPAPGTPNAGMTSGDVQSSISAAPARFREIGADFQYIRVPLSGGAVTSGRPPAAGPQTPPATGTQTPPAGTVTEPPRTTGTVPPAPATDPGRTPSGSGTVQTPQDRPSVSEQPGAAAEPSGTGQGTERPVSPAVPGGTAGTPSVPGGSTASGGNVPAIPDQPGGQDRTPGDTIPQTPPGGNQGSAPPEEDPVRTPPGGSGTAAPVPENPPADRDPSPVRTSSGFSFTEFLRNIPLPLLIGLIILVLLILGLIIFFMVRNLHDSPNRAMASAAGSAYRPPREDPQQQPQDEAAKRNAELLASFAANQRRPTSPYQNRSSQGMGDLPLNGPLMLSLFVEDQNTAIGRRNVHTVKSGYSFTVGGGKSDFLIFLVPMPQNIAEVKFDGQNCTFIPRKPQYFPDIGSQTVSNCIGKNIRVISDKKYELHIRIERYRDPLETLNRLLHSIDLPGVPEP
ncbi:VWA domain-containing protein [Breznakiella homolactica]|uniref:VWA domain-containing protein n=1 Tax=Breznakiella homolactica TaxID=2798577 RepID=A0A7T8B9P8_9SPIR|nr:VWA domain-containing protein [Breznakiella homolactica]QQO08180.1 VWA domain-containing protein [Breznakiella homolactica]